ncbi:MAG: hypothetical protein MZU97_16165 [Bacillus subtilis]|nr:hypothetical protein [Bacillus subtilis]
MKSKISHLLSKFLNVIRSHPIDWIIGTILFFQIFIIPEWAIDYPEISKANIILIVILLVEYLIYKIVLFFKKIPVSSPPNLPDS